MTAATIGRAAATLAILLATASCAAHTGPVLGDWRGEEPARAIGYQTELEIILDGPPGASGGTYHFLALNQGAELGVGSRDFRWSDRWSMRPLTVDGRPMRIVHLARLAGPHAPDYILTPAQALVPQPDPAHPDLTANALRVALYPVPRDSYGYGRP